MDKETVIKGCEYWVNNHKDETLPLAYSSVVELLAMLKEQEEQIKNRDESLEKAREEIKWLRGMLKEREAVEPEVDYICGNIVNVCGKCKSNLIARVKFCPWCGQAVKWQ